MKSTPSRRFLTASVGVRGLGLGFRVATLGVSFPEHWNLVVFGVSKNEGLGFRGLGFRILGLGFWNRLVFGVSAVGLGSEAAKS